MLMYISVVLLQNKRLLGHELVIPVQGYAVLCGIHILIQTLLPSNNFKTVDGLNHLKNVVQSITLYSKKVSVFGHDISP